MRLFPDRHHHVLRTILGDRGFGPGLYEKAFDTRREMAEQAGKGRAVPCLADQGHVTAQAGLFDLDCRFLIVQTP